MRMPQYPGTWYIPWGMPFDKIMSLPFQPSGAAVAFPVPAPASNVNSEMPPNSHLTNAFQLTNQSYHHQMNGGVPTAVNCDSTTSLLPSASLEQRQHGNRSILLRPTNKSNSVVYSPLSLRTDACIGNAMLNPCSSRHHQHATAHQLLCCASHNLLPKLPAVNLSTGVVASNFSNATQMPTKKILHSYGKELTSNPEKRKADDIELERDLKKAKLETKALKAKRPGFTDERYHETSYFIDNGLRKVYPYYFTFTTFTKGRWVGEKILEVFAREFRAHPAKEYERCIRAGTLTVNYEKVPIDYKLKHNDLLANIVHRHEVPVTSQSITIVHMDEDIVVVNKPASIPVHPCGRYRHNTVVFILAKEYNLKNLRTVHRLDRLTSGLLLFGRNPKKARQMDHQIRNREVNKEYICRVEGIFPEGIIECKEPIQVVSYKIGVCKVSSAGKECLTTFQRLSHNGTTSIVLCKPRTGRMHQIRVHLQYLGFPVVNDPLYNHEVFGPLKGRGGDIGGKTDEQLVNELINIHNAENWLGIDDSDISLFKTTKYDCYKEGCSDISKEPLQSEDDFETVEKVAQFTDERTSVSTKVSMNSTLVEKKNSIDNKAHNMITVGTQTDHESPDLLFSADKMTIDPHCYECKVRYRDPKPKDLVMYLHAWKYKGPGWEYETDLPDWANENWVE